MNKVKNILCLPLLIIFPPHSKIFKKLGLLSTKEARLQVVFPCIQGKLLDIGAGDNELVKRYKNGVGVDAYDWGGGALIVENSAKLPFPDEELIQ